MELCGESDQLMTPWVVSAITYSFLYIQKFIFVVPVKNFFPVKKMLFDHKSWSMLAGHLATSFQ